MRSIHKLLFSLFISLLLSGSLFAMTLPRPQTAGLIYPIVKKDTLLNGLQLVVMEKPGSGAITLRVRVNSGAMFDLYGKGGLAEITAGMLLKGGGGLSAKNVLDTVEQLNLQM